MSSWTVRDVERDNVRVVSSHDEAIEKVNDMVTLGAHPDHLKIISPSGEVVNEAHTDESTESIETGNEQTPEMAEHTEDTAESGHEPVPVESDTDLNELGDSLATDPLDILPDHMIDHIQGQPAISKRGYAMIAERYDIEVKADVLEYPWENEDSRAVAKALATTDKGKEYSGWGTASAGDGDMSDQLIELAETRALKRAVSWSSGVGIVSYHEMADEL
jgi:hypothetical protein